MLIRPEDHRASGLCERVEEAKSQSAEVIA